MAESDMIEKVARAIAEGWNDDGDFGNPNGNTRRWYEGRARAAIEAMREPTEAMLNGARDWSLKVNGQGVGNTQATGCFQAMIDAALTEPKEGTAE